MSIVAKALSITDLKKIYSNGFEALKGISFDIEEGDFFALLGPNGAGKSTTINVVSHLLKPTSGIVKVLGRDIRQNSDETKLHVGLVPQEFNFNIFEKVKDIIINQAGYYGIPAKQARVSAEKYLKALGLWEKKDSIARSLSGGMKRRLMIARALVHEPELLLLDEPTAGVDVELRRTMWEFLQNINREGKTIVLTTHYLEEAEKLCNNVAILNRGEILLKENVKELLATLKKEAFILDLMAPIESLASFQNSNFKVKLLEDGRLELIKCGDISMADILNELAGKNIQVKTMTNRASRLEELFIDLVTEGGSNDEC